MKELIIEVSSEVCFRAGGIHTVIESKAASMVERVGKDNYVLVGPFMGDAQERFIPYREIPGDGIGAVVQKLFAGGLRLHFGEWDIEGKPQVILLALDPQKCQVAMHKQHLLQHFDFSSENDPLVEALIIFADHFKELVRELAQASQHLVIHFHEFITALSLLAVKDVSNVHTVFTTHATRLGRALAPYNQGEVHKAMPCELKQHLKGTLLSRVRLEELAVRHCGVLTTVSSITAKECESIHNRYPDVITFNGLNVHSMQRHRNKASARGYLQAFADQHFLKKNIPFKREKAMHFFSSGRNEFRNKGLDLTVAALGQLNKRLKASKHESEVIVYFILGPSGLEMSEQISPDELDSDYSNLVCTPLTTNSEDLAMLRALTQHGLSNQPEDCVKIIFHVGFVNSNSPLEISYLELVSACDLGLFPSLYEPWGYTPVECIALGVPCIISNTTGLSDYVKSINLPCVDNGLFVIQRDKELSLAVDEMASVMETVVCNPIDYTARLMEDARRFEWKDNLLDNYTKALHLSMQLDRHDPATLKSLPAWVPDRQSQREQSLF
jgi:glycogen synthase